MLLQERVSAYDVLARQLANKGFRYYKKYLTSTKDLLTFFTVRYVFPAAGVPKDWKGPKYHIENDNILKSRIRFNVFPIIRLPDGRLYSFNGTYIRDDGEISIKLIVENFKESFIAIDWQEFYYDLLGVIRHELEHQVQYYREHGIPVFKSDFEDDKSMRKNRYYSSSDKAHEIYSKFGKSDKTRQVLYYTELASEIEAELKNHYLISKKTKKPFRDVAKKWLNDLKLSSKQVDYVLEKWEEYRKKHFSYMPSLKSF